MSRAVCSLCETATGWCAQCFDSTDAVLAAEAASKPRHGKSMFAIRAAAHEQRISDEADELTKAYPLAYKDRDDALAVARECLGPVPEPDCDEEDEVTP